MSIKGQQLTKRQREVISKALHAAAIQLEKHGSATSFIDTFLTDSEKITLGRRILIAQMILSGYSQPEIRFQLRISPNTFTKTRKWLQGKIPEYDKALKHAATSQRVKTKRKKAYTYNPFTFKALRTRYPLHFLFFTGAEKLLEHWQR